PAVRSRARSVRVLARSSGRAHRHVADAPGADPWRMDDIDPRAALAAHPVFRLSELAWRLERRPEVHRAGGAVRGDRISVHRSNLDRIAAGRSLDRCRGAYIADVPVPRCQLCDSVADARRPTAARG